VKRGNWVIGKGRGESASRRNQVRKKVYIPENGCRHEKREDVQGIKDLTREIRRGKSLHFLHETGQRR